MKKFILNILLFSFFTGISIVFVFYIADVNADQPYIKFSSPPQQSLIIGTSRAWQGLQPEVFNTVFSKAGKQYSFFNYAFTLGHSPYGPAYLKSIEKKINPSAKNCMYIVTIDPWSISGNKDAPNDSSNFSELDRYVAKTYFVNANPNILYLINSYDDPYFNIIKRKLVKPANHAHSDGWLEVNVPMDSASMKERLDNKIKDYETNNLPYMKFSQTRFNYFIKTINFLKTHGTVYLVRLPIHPRMLALENILMPKFDSLINYISISEKVDYFNYKDSTGYQFTDGNHLYKLSGKKLSQDIANRILNKK